VIFRRNTDARRNLRNQHINFHVYYEIDEQEAEYALSFDSYHKEGTGDACRHWVLLEVKEKLRNDDSASSSDIFDALGCQEETSSRCTSLQTNCADPSSSVITRGQSLK
jgi:hypothetical protein